MLKEDMLHYSYMNISQFLKKFDFYSSFEAGFMLDRESGQFHQSPALFSVQTCYPLLPALFYQRGFRDGIPGLFCAFFDALNIMVRYFKLWELKREKCRNNR